MLRRWTPFLVLGGLATTFFVGWQSGAAHAENEAKSRVFELRTYTTLEGRLPALNARFRDHTVALFEKHGMTNVIYLTPMDDAKKDNTLVYLLAHDSRDAAKASFQAFGQDPEWKAAREASEADCKIVSKVESVFFTPTDYSPMK
ncbi:NIPSNAP family protein [bacterium]|nr:NIPSNAP family protein [bacterium]